jgi:hypothetical protein
LLDGMEWALAQDRDAIAMHCAEAAQPFHAARVLEPFYQVHRDLHRLAKPRPEC